LNICGTSIEHLKTSLIVNGETL